MVEVKWTKNALDEIDSIAEYISNDSPKYADFLVKQIYEMIDHLNQFPKIGRIVPETNNSNIREILFRNYRIIYLIKKEHLEIISIFHGSRVLNL